MISNLPRGLSRRVVCALHERLRRAMSGDAAADATMPVPETRAPEVAEAAPEAAPNVNAPAEEASGADAPPGDGARERDRTRFPRRSDQPVLLDEERQRIKDELCEELLKDVLGMLPPLSDDEEVTTARVLQSNLSLGMANVSLVGKLESAL